MRSQQVSNAQESSFNENPMVTWAKNLSPEKAKEINDMLDRSLLVYNDPSGDYKPYTAHFYRGMLGKIKNFAKTLHLGVKDSGNVQS